MLNGLLSVTSLFALQYQILWLTGYIFALIRQDQQCLSLV